MIIGVHALIYSQQAEAVRAFLRDTLGYPSVDAGDGWLIFGLPPAELAVHPTDGEAKHELTLMCDDINATITELTAQGVEFSQPVSDQGFGLVAMIQLPDGSELMLYQPRHPTAISPDGGGQPPGR